MQYIYLLREGGDYYKVGISHNVRSRVSMLQSNMPRKIEIVCTKFLDTKAYEAEQELHKYLEAHKTDGANEWFKLTPEKALELCIIINNYPDIDITERVTLAILAQTIKRNQRLVEKKLDVVLNAYQKDIRKSEAEVVTELINIPTTLSSRKDEKEEEDRRLYDRAIEIVKEQGQASTSMLQRKLQIGYSRASRFIEQMEGQGLITGADGSRARKILQEQ